MKSWKPGFFWMPIDALMGQRVRYLGIATCSSNRVRTHDVFRVGSNGVSPRLFLAAENKSHFKGL